MKALISPLFLMTPAVVCAQEPFDTEDPLDDNFRTGVEVGEKIPEFRARDANGKFWDFDAIKGPRGAVLHFYRSADW